MTNIDKMIDCSDGIEIFLSIGKNVDDVQDELKNLLFGEEDEASNYGSLTEKVNILDHLALYHQTKNLIQEKDILELDDDLLDSEFEEDISDRKSDDPDAPLAVRLVDNIIPFTSSYTQAELRQRPFRNGPPGRRRRPFRGRLPSQSQGRPSVMRPNSPIRDIRDPGLHRIPGRIQAVPDRFSQDVFGSTGLSQLSHNSIAPAVDCDFYTDDLCLAVEQYPM